MRKVNHWGINTRVVLTAIIPVIIFAFVFGAYIHNARNQDLLRELNERGGLIANNLATASEFPVATRNIDLIRVLVDASMNQKDVVGVRIVDETGKLLLKRGSYGGESKGDISQYPADIVSTALDDVNMLGEPVSADDDNSKLLLGTVEVYISNESYLIRQKSILVKTMVITFVGIILSILFAVLIGNGVVRPVREVIEAVASLTHGNLTVRVPGKAGGELGKLQSGINEMAETIASSQMRLEREVKDATSELKTTVIELERKNEELDKARSEAMKAKDAKTEFLANMSHEIRTPLNAIIGFSRELDKSNLDDKQQECSRTINSAARQLLTVIDDILSFSKLESGRLKIFSKEFLLRDCFENIVLMLSQLANEKDIELVLLINADVPDVVKGDQDRISQVLTNLVNNAIKFTDHGTVVIQVSVDEDDNIVNISVTDTGCGISKEAQSKLFTPFYQENQHTSKRHGGTGLGLVICQRLITMMGGELSFKSEDGVGSKFSFNLPLRFVSMHEYATIDKPVNVFVLDTNAHSRRAIRNNLVYMGFRVFSVDKIKKLINNLRNVEATDDSIVMVSLPPGHGTNHYYQFLHDDIRANHHGLIVLLTTQAHTTGDNQDTQVKIVNKPARLTTLSSILMPDIETEKTESVTEHLRTYEGYSVLVAEDNEFNQKYISSLLQGLGITVTCVENGNKALVEAKRNSFDMIFMDLHMPELDGMDATKMIRNLPNGIASVPIIAITADVFANDNGQLTEKGFTDCMFKPIDEDKLYNIIESNLASHTKEAVLGKSRPAEIDMNALMNIPEGMRKRLFSDLYAQYDELEKVLGEKAADKAREHVHKILGLVCYFKVNELEEIINSLQNAVRQKDFETAQKMVSNALERTKSIEELSV